jgi:hypothetical protein
MAGATAAAAATLALDAGADGGEARARAVVAALAAVAEAMAAQAPTHPQPPSAPRATKFDAFRAPAISVRDYLARIHKYASCSAECFVLALVYVDRLHQLQGVALSPLNVHRVLLTSVVLAAKFFDDHYFNNAYYAKVGGVPGAEMNELELEFLLLVNFSLHVPCETFARYYNELANHAAFRAVRAAASADAAFFHERHFVVPDPEQHGALVYVTKRVARHPPRPLFRAPAGFYAADQPADHDRDAQAAAAAAAGTPTAAAAAAAGTAACTKTSRASGQKRRSAVALGVNA